MTGPERKIQEECERFMRMNGWTAERTEHVSDKGWPDTTFHKLGRVLYVEFKTKVGKQSPQQKRVARRLALSGHTVIVARGWDDLCAFA
jgi:hypothetical protein